MVSAALRAFEREASSGEFHWTHTEEFQKLQKRVNLIACGKEYINYYAGRPFPLGEIIHRDGKEFRVVKNSNSVKVTAELV